MYKDNKSLDDIINERDSDSRDYEARSERRYFEKYRYQTDRKWRRDDRDNRNWKARHSYPLRSTRKRTFSEKKEFRSYNKEISRLYISGLPLEVTHEDLRVGIF
jgi:hypothetical protein